MNDFGLLVGRYLTALPTLVTTELSELQLDSKGRLIVAGRFITDTDSFVSGDSGISILAVRNDTEGTLVDTDGDYAPLQVDSKGRLRVVADLEVENSFEKVEDSVHANADIGAYILAVRSDTRPANAGVSASGDYASFFVNASGELYVKDTDSLAKLTEIDTVLDSIYVDTQAIVVDLAAIEVELLDQGTTLDAIETELLDQGTTLDAIETELLDQGTTLDAIETEILDQGTTLDSIESNIISIVKEEDTAHSSGDKGVMPLAVQTASEGALAGDGDYAPLQVDSDGRLRVVADATADAVGDESYNAADSLAPGGDGLIGSISDSFVDITSVSVAAGETAYIYGWQWDCDKNATGRLITVDGVNTIVYKVRMNSSADPGIAEHWSEGGRIEIAGSATPLVIKLQVRKRISAGADASASGSLHIRKV